MTSDCMGSGIGVSLGFGRDVSEGIRSEGKRATDDSLIAFSPHEWLSTVKPQFDLHRQGFYLRLTWCQGKERTDLFNTATPRGELSISSSKTFRSLKEELATLLVPPRIFSSTVSSSVRFT